MGLRELESRLESASKVQLRLACTGRWKLGSSPIRKTRRPPGIRGENVGLNPLCIHGESARL
jgi:hypothetical protein